MRTEGSRSGKRTLVAHVRHCPEQSQPFANASHVRKTRDAALALLPVLFEEERTQLIGR